MIPTLTLHLNHSKSSRLFALLFFLLSFSFYGQAQAPSFCISNNAGSQSVTVDVTTNNFTDILSVQFSVNWDPNKLEFDSTSNLDNLNLTGTANFGQQLSSNGYLTFSWLDADISGESLPNGAILFSLNFKVLEGGNTPVTITSNPTALEVVRFPGDVIDPTTIDLKSGMVNGVGVTLQGKVYDDNDLDCNLTAGDAGMDDWILKIENSEHTYFASSNDVGDYSIFIDTGSYVVTPILPNNYWQSCQSTYSITLTENDSFVDLDIPLQKAVSCTAMEVDISAPILRRCFSNNQYTVNYCNKGTAVATDAYIEITFDPYLSVESSSVNWTTQNGNTYTFPTGDVDYGDCGSFWVQVTVSCEAVLGTAHCTDAHIFPNEFCDPPNVQWSGASLTVSGSCNPTNDSIIFLVENVGVANMIESSFYAVIEDAIMLTNPQPIVPLQSGASETITLEATGATYRFQVDQVDFHPGNSMPSVTVEGCGTNGSGETSLGFVNQFSQNEGDPFISIDCQENVGSYDPNDKQAFPKGFSDEKYIEPNTDIEYLIRFQNTGTDTAFNVVVRDTLSEFLNPATIRPGVSSHPYDFQITDGGIAVFEFNNILLPDSNINEPASHGFVKFKISQQPNVPLESVIKNDAAIFFDFNLPIITNTVFHTIGEHFITVNTQNVLLPNLTVQTYPNPFREMVQFEIKGKAFEVIELKLFNLSGSLVKATTHSGNTFNLYRNNLPSGMFFYTLTGDGALVSTGKIIIE